MTFNNNNCSNNSKEEIKEKIKNSYTGLKKTFHIRITDPFSPKSSKWEDLFTYISYWIQCIDSLQNFENTFE